MPKTIFLLRIKRGLHLAWFMVAVISIGSSDVIAAYLVAHWPLTRDTKELVSGLNTEERGKIQFSQFEGRAAAQFNELDSYLQVKDDSKLALGTGDFSISM